MSKICKDLELMLGTCADFLATANSNLQLSVNRRFVEGEKDYVCFLDVLPFQMHVYKMSVLKLDSDTPRSGKAVAAGVCFRLR